MNNYEIYERKLQELIDDSQLNDEILDGIDDLEEEEVEVFSERYSDDCIIIGFDAESKAGYISVTYWVNDGSWDIQQESNVETVSNISGQGFNNLIDALATNSISAWFGNIMDPQNYYVEEEEEITENCDDKLNEGLGTRDYSDMLFDMIEDGTVDPVQIAEDLIYWCTEEDIEEYMRVNNLIWEEDEEETDDFI